MRLKGKNLCKRAIKLLAQLGLIVGFYYAGCALASVLPIAIPGNILGMLLLICALCAGIIKEHHVGHACTFLLDRMALFFLPAGVGVMGSSHMLEGIYLKFAFICIVTTVIVFVATSMTVVGVSRLTERLSHAYWG